MMKIMTIKIIISCLIFCGVGVVVFCLGTMVGTPGPEWRRSATKSQITYMDYLTDKGYEPKLVSNLIFFDHDGGEYVLVIDGPNEVSLGYLVDSMFTEKLGHLRKLEIINQASLLYHSKIYVRNDNIICIKVSTFLRHPKDIKLVFDDMQKQLYHDIIRFHQKLKE